MTRQISRSIFLRTRVDATTEEQSFVSSRALHRSPNHLYHNRSGPRHSSKDQMNRMGSSCSRDASFRGTGSAGQAAQSPPERSDSFRSHRRRALRHSVVSAIPDNSISTLYPVDENYVLESDGRRSPKSLADLATDALCRSLALLNGDLPPGLPQDAVNSIANSLVSHSALNATTLRIFKNCELNTLSLAGCRGVNDAWLEALVASTFSGSNQRRSLPALPDLPTMAATDIDGVELRGCLSLDGGNDYEDMSACSTSSFVSAASHHNKFDDGDDPSVLDSASLPSPYHHRGARSVLTMGDGHSQEPGRAHNVTYALTLLDLRGSTDLTDRGLLQLCDLANLEIAKLDNCHGLVGYGLLALSSSRHLHTLSLANCRRLTDEAVISVSHLSGIRALVLDGCRCLTNRSMTALSELKDLRKLGLSQCDLITDQGLEPLATLDKLEELSLGWCRRISDHGIDALTLQPGRASNMTILRLARVPVTDEGVAHLARLVAVEELDLSGCPNVSSAALGKALHHLVRLKVLDLSYCPGILRAGLQGKVNSIRSLDLRYSGVKDAHMGKLASLPLLEELCLDSCPVGDWTIAHLADNNVAPNLRSLDLADTDLTDAGMPKLATFNLKRLSLFYCNITNVGLQHVGKLKSLEVLNLDSREISDDGLRHLQHLRNLKSLDIFSGRITDAGCSHISAISSLESLELCGGGVGDLGCIALATLENLTCLNLSQNERITNRGAAALAALTNLKVLNLSNTRVNSSALRFFGGLIKLQSLALYGCRGIDQPGNLEKLQNVLPNLKCLRLNRSSDQDGVVLTDGSSDDDSDSGMWSENGQRGSDGMDQDVHADTLSDHD